MRYSLGVSMKQLSLLLMTAVTRKQMYRDISEMVNRPSRRDCRTLEQFQDIECSPWQGRAYTCWRITAFDGMQLSLQYIPCQGVKNPVENSTAPCLSDYGNLGDRWPQAPAHTLAPTMGLGRIWCWRCSWCLCCLSG